MGITGHFLEVTVYFSKTNQVLWCELKGYIMEASNSLDCRFLLSGLSFCSPDILISSIFCVKYNKNMFLIN